MDYLEGWELVPGHDDGGREKLSSPKHGGADSQSESEEVLCPSPSPPVSPRLDTEIPTEKNKEEIPTPTIIIAKVMESEDPVPVFPISLKETEFVDMKFLESKSKSLGHDEEEEEDQVVNKDDSDESDGGCGGVGGGVGVGGEGGFDLWKWGWGLTGIGALCSFGVATMFVLVLGATSGTGTGPGIQAKNNMGFKGYEENQRLKEMVSAVRGGSVPLTRAHITLGGYYDAPSLNH